MLGPTAHRRMPTLPREPNLPTPPPKIAFALKQTGLQRRIPLLPASLHTTSRQRSGSAVNHGSTVKARCILIKHCLVHPENSCSTLSSHACTQPSCPTPLHPDRRSKKVQIHHIDSDRETQGCGSYKSRCQNSTPAVHWAEEETAELAKVSH